MSVDTVSSNTARPTVEPVVPQSGTHGTSVSASTATPPHSEHAAPVEPAQAADAARQVARQINEFLKNSSTSVEIGFDESLNRFIVRIVDGETQRVIRQMPTQEVLAISDSLNHVTGVLLTQKA